MSNEIEETITALKTAVEIENQGYNTYKKFADQTDNEAGKRIFLQLAKDEVRHKEILEDQLNKLTDGQPLESIEIPKSVIEQVAPKIRQRAVDTKSEKGIGELDALNTALDLEKRAFTFFKEQADLTALEETKAMFLRLAEWEDNHYDIIKAEIDNINHTGFYYDIPEFQMDGMY